MKITLGQQKGGILVKVVLGFFVLFFALVGFVIIFGEEVPITDEDIVKTYQPTEEIGEIVEKTSFSTRGKALFYSTNPEMVDIDTFNTKCTIEGDRIELSAGCLRGGGEYDNPRIFILIPPEKFADQKYSTAVHEMLHMAYYKLPDNEKNKVRSLIESELANRRDDGHLASIAKILSGVAEDNFDARESIINELHSIFGTEYNNLSPELENYYSQYFIDRAQVVSLFQEGQYAQRRKEMDRLILEAARLETQLTNMRTQLNNYQQTGNTTAYNNAVNQYNRLVNQYNAKVGQIQNVYAEIEEFYKYINPNFQPPQPQ